MMKKIIGILFVLSFVLSLFSQATLDPRYHTYEEVITELNQYEQDYPDIAKVYVIGETNTDHIPIYALKISDNVATDEDEVALMFAGQCHAEEVLGVEVVMYMIDDILNHRYQTPYRYWIQNEEIWMIPTYNPEGLSVVMEGLDVTYRKNKTDTNNNGVFDYVPGQGNDLDGVDQNRNFAFNWVHGDTLYCPEGYELYDYYRGPYPFSEGGPKALKELAEQQFFLFSIAWHSSRTGNHSQKLHYSFEWQGGKRCPDFNENQAIGVHVASLIEKFDGTGTYEPLPSIGRKGLAHDWFYQAFGTFQYEIECGGSNIQPAAEIVDQVCANNSVGAYYLLNRAIGYQTDRNMLTGHITDSNTGEPLSAEIIVLEKNASYFKPRMSDQLYGRFFRILEPGIYTVKFRKKGYEDKIIEDVSINASSPTTLNVQLDPLPEVSVSGTIKAGAQYLNSTIYILGDYPDTVYCSNGIYQIDTYQGDFHIIIDSEGFFPIEYNQYFEGGNYTHNFNMEDENIIYEEDFENDLSDWEVNGTWYFGYDSTLDTNYLSTTTGQFYENNLDISITSPTFDTNNFSLPAFLEFTHKYHTEHDNDVCYIEAKIDDSDWQTLKTFSGVKDYWSKEFISLPQDENSYNIQFRFRFHSDETLNDPGWSFDNIRIVNSAGTDFDNNAVIFNTSLSQNYPNPFYLSSNSKNQYTKISFNLKSDSSTNLSVYNIKGQLVKTLIYKENLKSGKHMILWDGKNKEGKKVSTGVYFYKLDTAKKSIVKKMLVIK
jgi:hypothetical protein